MKIELRPAVETDRQQIYEWLARSDATTAIYMTSEDQPLPVPDYREFCDDYDKSAFDPAGKFRVYIIVVDEREIGIVQYYLVDRIAELDIWIGCQANWGKGIGPKVLRMVLQGLQVKKLADRAVIRPSARNLRAVAAYRRAGFTDFDPATEELPAWCSTEGMDYPDTIILVQWLDPVQLRATGG